MTYTTHPTYPNMQSFVYHGRIDKNGDSFTTRLKLTDACLTVYFSGSYFVVPEDP